MTSVVPKDFRKALAEEMIVPCFDVDQRPWKVGSYETWLQRYAAISRILPRFDLDLILKKKEWREMLATAAAMADRDLFHLPFPSIWLQARVDSVTTEGLPTVLGVFCHEDSDEKGTTFSLNPFIWVSKPGYRHWYDLGMKVETTAIPMDFEIEGTDLEQHGIPIRVFHSEFRFDDATGRRLQHSERVIAQTVIARMMTLIVLLRTQGVVKQFVPWVKKRSKRAAKVRHQAELGYTRVKIPTTNGPATSKGSRNYPDERRRPRLHLRRGHTKMVPYGPGRELRRETWIEPTLVGYKDDGEIVHDYQVAK